MKRQYYAPGPERGRRVRELFGRIASRYDLINDVQSAGLHRLWKREMVAEVPISAETRAMDVCCGTGDVAIRFAKEGVEMVVGCDFSPEMLAQAALRTRNRVQWVQADALDLPFADQKFDLVASAYGLRNLADIEQGLREMGRVLKNGGSLLILDFGKPPNRVWRTLYFAYLRVVVPLFGLIFCGDAAAYAYILQSLQNYPAQEGIARMLKSQGCRVRIKNFLGGVMSLHVATKE